MSIFSTEFFRRVSRGALVGARIAAGADNLHKLRMAWYIVRKGVFAGFVLAVVAHALIASAPLIVPMFWPL